VRAFVFPCSVMAAFSASFDEPGAISGRQVLDCASPLVLWRFWETASQSGRGLPQSKTLSRRRMPNGFVANIVCFESGRSLRTRPNVDCDRLSRCARCADKTGLQRHSGNESAMNIPAATLANKERCLSAIARPGIDPTPIFEMFRGNYGTELLAVAVTHFNLFGRLSERALSFDDLRRALGLAERPANVLLTALQSMGLLLKDGEGRFDLSPLAREHLVPGAAFDVSDYIGLAAKSPGVQLMIERLESNRPAGFKAAEPGAAFIYKEGMDSAMEKEASARSLTLALAGRAKNVAPLLAERIPLQSERTLLDVGGGAGIYSIAFLQKNPQLQAIVLDRPEVLKVAAEFAMAYGVADRLECRAGDMFAGSFPSGIDVVLLSNVLHDWDVPEGRSLVRRCADTLPTGGRLLIHDVFLNDSLDGPPAIALYSAALFSVTEGRAYSAAEYRDWMEAAGLVTADVVPTLIHCGVLVGTKKGLT